MAEYLPARDVVHKDAVGQGLSLVLRAGLGSVPAVGSLAGTPPQWASTLPILSQKASPLKQDLVLLALYTFLPGY